VTNIPFSLASLCVLLVTALTSPTQAEDSSATARCIVRPAGSIGLHNRGDPVSVSGLMPQIRIPSEGELQLAPVPNSQTENRAWSPTGDATSTVGPYDPVTQRLYVWGYFEAGWIEVLSQSGTWLFGEKGKIKPRLYERRDKARAGGRMQEVRRSDVLGYQFYEGWTAHHWLTSQQTYRSYELVGTKMRRALELERRNLIFVGDDPVARMAVFVPNDVPWMDWQGNLVWYDGIAVIEPSADQKIPNAFCK
jgi:hypothetical protein